MDYEFLIMLAILIVAFYVKILYGVLFLLFWIGVMLFGFFFTTMGIGLMPENLNECELYYSSHQGEYNKLVDKLKEFKQIKRKFKLPENFMAFGIFYDNNLKVDNVAKCRSVYGILKEKTPEDNFDIKEFKSYMKENNFKVDYLPMTRCMIGFYDPIISIYGSLSFLAKIIIETATRKFMTRVFNPAWKNIDIKIARKNYNKRYGLMEIYDSKTIRMCIPLENEKEFFIYDS